MLKMGLKAFLKYKYYTENSMNFLFRNFIFGSRKTKPI